MLRISQDVDGTGAVTPVAAPRPRRRRRERDRRARPDLPVRGDAHRHAGTPAREPPTLGDGYFAECSGLELEADVKEHLEGGRNDGVVRRVGRAKLSPIVLKRGMFVPAAGEPADPALWDWITAMFAGTLPIPRYDGLVQVFAPNRKRRGRPLGVRPRPAEQGDRTGAERQDR